MRWIAAAAKALEDLDAVIQSLGVALSLEMVFKKEDIFSTATRILVDAMKEKNVKRLICVTGYGVGDSRNTMGFLLNAAFNLFLGRIYADKEVQERIIRDSAPDWG